MNKRPGHVEVTNEVGYCSFCSRTRNLRSEEHHLGTLVRTIVTCETCHRTLSSSIGVAQAEAAIAEEPAEVEAVVEKTPRPQEARPKAAATKRSAATPASRKSTTAAKPAAKAGKPASRPAQTTSAPARKVTKRK
ncbi:MAG TPA: hypothetical protein VGE99_03750 [Candidatus Dormibacteraeota bacterium]